MDNNRENRPRKKVTKKMLRQRQFGALAVISFLVLLFFIFIAKACSNSGEGGMGSKQNATTTTAPVTTTAAPVTTSATTTVHPLAAQVILSKRSMYIDIGQSDISYITGYPQGSAEVNEVWRSLDASIASVDEYGHVTGVSQGETFIILSFDNNPGIELEIKVTVADPSGIVPNGGAAVPTEGASDSPVVSFTTPVAMIDDDFIV